jgi:hypothetical protein
MPGGVGNWLIGAGIALLVIGLIVKAGLLSWFGDLPGDIHIKREGFEVFVPLASMIVISVALSAIAALLRRFL